MSENTQSVNTADNMEILETTETGNITFANEVIATIASLAAAEIDGVGALGGGVADGFAELLGMKSNTKGVKIEAGSSDVSVDCTISVKYGYKVQDVAANVQSNIKNAIEMMTGLNVLKVNVAVTGILVQPKKASKKESE